MYSKAYLQRYHMKFKRNQSRPQKRTSSEYASKIVAKLHDDNKFRKLEWPSQSPDVSPMENLWEEVKKSVQARRPTNQTQLHQYCQE